LHGHTDGVEHNEKCYCIFEVFIIYKSKELALDALGLADFDPQLLALANFLNFNPTSLLLCYKHVSQLLLFFDQVEIIYKNSYKEIDDKLVASEPGDSSMRSGK